MNDRANFVVAATNDMIANGRDPEEAGQAMAYGFIALLFAARFPGMSHGQVIEHLADELRAQGVRSIGDALIERIAADLSRIKDEDTLGGSLRKRSAGDR